MARQLFARNRSFNLRFLALIILSIMLMVLNHHHDHFKRARKVLGVAVTPLQYLVNFPAKMVEWVEGSFSSHQALLAENADLQAKVLLAQARLQKMISLQKENAQLRALLQASPKPNARLLVAQLLAVDPDPFVQQVVLNKGSNQAIYVGQPVLDGNGVFGQVIQTGPITSRVLLITDTRSAIPVQDNRSGIRGIVVGEGDATTLNLMNMPVTADIKVGDLLVTSGLGERFPMGYPVGVVQTITKSPGRQFAKITVIPSAHIYRSHLVLLIWPNIEKTLKEQAVLKKERLKGKTKLSEVKGHDH